MSNQRSALGRGLEALIPKLPATPARADTAATRTSGDAPTSSMLDASGSSPTAGLLELAVASIRPNPDQPRRVFDSDKLAELAESIRRHGVLQPVVVTRAGDGYELVVGERRWRASQAAGKETIPAVVADVAPGDRLAVALVENVQRRDLNPLELAHAFRALAAAGATQDQIGESVGLDRSTIANHLRVLELPRDLQRDLEAGTLAMGHAKALLQLRGADVQREVRDQIIGKALSVRATEALIRKRTAPGRQPVPRAERTDVKAGVDNSDTRALIDALRTHLQTQVRITGKDNDGKIEIHFAGPEDLDRLCHIILGPL